MTKPKIFLAGPEGNAYSLMSLVRKYGRQLGLPEDAMNDMLRDMKSSDYEHLVSVFVSNFGMVVDVYNVDGTLITTG